MNERRRLCDARAGKKITYGGNILLNRSSHLITNDCILQKGYELHALVEFPEVVRTSVLERRRETTKRRLSSRRQRDYTPMALYRGDACSPRRN